ncbi:Neural cell adhesion molecule 1 [Oryzias melastigma]|uniref:Neural cell adhesion molecule 1 n=1 Tax=Oryzias melastigma TaxID=30732 RepID=A0A834FQ16_ORYME|nr:Neural cell adhesion molecule 1 [Oryzias melastigma]
MIAGYLSLNGKLLPPFPRMLLGRTAIQVQITPAQGEISVGESKFFLCEVTGEAKDIDWYTPSGEKILHSMQDLSVSRSDEVTSSLTIYHANVDSAGIYKCVARDGEKEAQATVQVKIFQKITFQSAPSPQEFTEGDTADIVCNVVSSPPPTIIWKHKGSKIQASKDVRYKIMANGHLQIRGIKKTDEGMYTCEARVMARGEIDFKTMKVVVNVLPTIRARQFEVNATADIGSSALLACDADGFPDPVVTWTHNGAALEEGDKYSLNEDGSELIIKDVKKVDEGDYTCTATNKAGEKSQEVGLNVFVQPKITYLNNKTASEFDEEVILTCEASGDPTPTISWSSESTIFTEGEQSLDRNIVVYSHARVSSLTLKNVQFTYAGQYLCIASNSIGQDSQSVYLEVRYSPKILGRVASYTWEKNPANISCEVDAHPEANVVWFKDGFPTAERQHHQREDLQHADSQLPRDVPSAPEIQQVESFSSTAMVEFKEPDSTGGVPLLKYRVEWRFPGKEWTHKEYSMEDGNTKILVTGLKPETAYEVKMSAINGKGEGESSAASSFKTKPVREPSAPKLEANLAEEGNSLRVTWIKQDDGGLPIIHYLVKYKAKHVPEWKPEIRVPSLSEHMTLNGLAWNTEYEVHVVAENQQGRSDPGVVSIKTAAQPTAIPGSAHGGSGLGTGAIVGILIVVFFLLLVGVDVTCYFLNKCGLLMCIAVNVCGKAGPGAKSKDIEEGKAAFTKDESKEPIVEVRTEEEHSPNQEVKTPTEPNETTPLTEAEPAVTETTPLVVKILPSTATNSVSESFSTAQSSPASESTTLTISTSSPTKAAPSTTSPNSSSTAPPGAGKTDPQPNVGPLVDLSDCPKAAPPSHQTPPALEPVSPPSDGQQSKGRLGERPGLRPE